jgi:hypothetical protein
MRAMASWRDWASIMLGRYLDRRTRARQRYRKTCKQGRYRNHRPFGGWGSCCDNGPPSPCLDNRGPYLGDLYPHPYSRDHPGNHPGLGHGHDRGHGYRGDEGSGSDLGKAEVSVYRFATQAMNGSWPTVCLGVNPETSIRACDNSSVSRALRNSTNA